MCLRVSKKEIPVPNEKSKYFFLASLKSLQKGVGSGIRIHYSEVRIAPKCHGSPILLSRDRYSALVRKKYQETSSFSRVKDEATPPARPGASIDKECPLRDPPPAPPPPTHQPMAARCAASSASFAAVARALKRRPVHRVEVVDLSDDDNDIVILTETAGNQAKPTQSIHAKGLHFFLEYS